MLMIEALFEQELELSKIEVEEEAIEAMIASYLEIMRKMIPTRKSSENMPSMFSREKIESLRLEYLEKLRGKAISNTWISSFRS